MKKNILLVGITIHVAALSMCAADAHAIAGDDKDNTTDDTPVETMTLRESVVNAHFANRNRTALRLAIIDEEQLRNRGAARTYPNSSRDCQDFMPLRNQAVMVMLN